MTALLAAAFGCLWLGILTSISPCPLATNIAAVSFLARHAHRRRQAVAGAMAYALGRVAAYLGIALLLQAGLASMPAVSRFLQNETPPLVGPLLVLTGMLVLEWLRLPGTGNLCGERLRTSLVEKGILGDFLLGTLFALSFCPISAALFFGSLVPLALPSSAPWLLVFLYGLGTALPVAILALMLVLGLSSTGPALKKLQTLQPKIKTATGTVLIAIGIWMTLHYTLELI